MALSLRMVSSFLLLVTVCTHCTDDESGAGGSGGNGRTGGAGGGRSDGGRTDEGGSGGEAQGGAGNLPVGGVAGERGTSPGAGGEGGGAPGGSGNTGGARPGGAGNGGSGGVEELPPECVPAGEAGSGVTMTCCWECQQGKPCRHLECGNGSVDRGCLVPFGCYEALPGRPINGPYYSEECDDGNLDDGDGCSSDCTRELGVNCGNGRLDPYENCDDGNLQPDDGCDASCRTELSYNCDVPGEPCIENVCGDGRSGRSQCDDGNTVSGDGCSKLCDIELGWTCPEQGACEEAYCGNRSVDEYSNDDEDGFAGAWNVGGVLIRREDCDDGNQVSGDGCSAHCRLEEGWTCESSSCHRPDCGDGYALRPEACDDGNDQPDDGCDEDCEIEPDWVCVRQPLGESTCTRSACGDGIVDPSADEECDDGNLRSRDGCSDECKIEGEACTDLTD